jgi:hypothetical protein
MPLGAPYRVRDGADRVTGWDLTFSAPKSVSVLWATAGAEVGFDVRDAHDAAVAAGVAYLEEHAAFARTGNRIAHVLSRAEACQRRLGFAGVSVAHAATGVVDDLCEMSPRLLDYDECAVITAGRVRERFGLAATGASPHFSIVLPAAELRHVRVLRDLFEVGVALPPPTGGR